MSNGAYLKTATEGLIDEQVALRLLKEAGFELAGAYGRKGKQHLRDRVSAYNAAAVREPWLMLVDLNSEADCAPDLRGIWLPRGAAENFCFRVAVREVEAWLLADAGAFAAFLSVSRSRIPTQPEALEDAKREVVNLGRSSRRRDIREDIVPPERSGRAVGPAYTSRVVEFVQSDWSPQRAADAADSLARCLAALAELRNRQ